MNLIKQWKYLLKCIRIIICMFLAVSFLVVVFSMLNDRFYSSVSLIVSFGLGGVFTAVFSYYDSLSQAPAKNDLARWSLIITMVMAGLFIFFFLSPIEGGEYESAFKSFGSTLAFSSLMFVWGKMEV